jgi:transcriptional regulator with GAF, ATPase, and Fis domain
MLASRAEVRPPATLLAGLAGAGVIDAQHVVEHLPHGVLIFRDTPKIVAANRVAEFAFGYGPGQLVGQPFECLVPEWAQGLRPGSGAEFWKQAQQRTVDRGRPFAGVRRDGLMVPVDIRLNVVLDGSRCHAVASITRASERAGARRGLPANGCDELTFRQLVTTLATRLSRVPAALVDQHISDALRLIAEALKLDRAILWRRSSDDLHAIPSHQWIHSAAPATPEARSLMDAPFIASKIARGELAWFARPDDLPGAADRDACRRLHLASAAVIPIATVGDAPGMQGALQFDSATPHDWPPAVIDQLHVLSCVLGQALALKASDVTLQSLQAELGELRKRVDDGKVEHRPAIRTTTHQSIVAESGITRRSVAHMEQVAPTCATVLLLGETGVGKEVFAQAIHDLSPRRNRRMIRVNCAALPSTLLESELFGREAGAYTGAATRQIGRFEAADQSTLFLDEIGELSSEDQVKLLHVLQDGVVERLGSTQPVKINVRVIAATNSDLWKAVEEKRFREDLFYRINVFPIHIAPLRDRIEDLPALVWQFIDEISASLGKRVDAISAESMRQLKGYAWPGNVRELRNVIERAIIRSTSRTLVPVLPNAVPPAPQAPPACQTLSHFEFEQIRVALDAAGWRIRGRGGAAERLGLKPTTLESRIAKLGLERPQVARPA